MQYPVRRMILKKIGITVTLLLLMTTGLNMNAMAGELNSGSDTADLLDTATSAGSFTKLLAAIDAAGLTDELKGEGPYTVFAPDDQAFARFVSNWPGTLNNLLLPENVGLLRQLLKYHVVPGKVVAADITAAMSITTLEGVDVRLTKSNGVMVDYANVTIPDIATSNGVIHVIDAVLIPGSPPS